jgi:hypothetical protein
MLRGGVDGHSRGLAGYLVDRIDCGHRSYLGEHPNQGSVRQDQDQLDSQDHYIVLAWFSSVVKLVFSWVEMV